MVENAANSEEELIFVAHSGCGCMRHKSENCNSIANPGTTFHKVGTLEHSCNGTEKIDF